VIICIRLFGASAENKAAAIQEIFRATARYYRTLRHAAPLPPLYRSGIRFQIPEPLDVGGEPAEEFLDPWSLYRRGYGDCDQVTLYRATELSDCQFQPRIYWRGPQFHIGLWRTDLQRAEDPSLILLGKSDAPKEK
jgi:hypothetical protein